MSGTDLRRAAALALAAALTLSGCTGTGAVPEATPEPTTTPNRWKAGEFTRDQQVCDAVSQETQDRLGVARVQYLPGAEQDSCSWAHRNDDGDYTLLLTLRQLRFEPPPPRPTRTASQEAQHEFGRPPGWGFRSATPVTGFGDQAKISRRYVPGNALKAVGTVIRVRNVLFLVEAESGTALGGMLSAEITEEDSRTASFARLEESVYAAAREVVAKVKGRIPPKRAAPGKSKGEVAKVKDVCGTRAATPRMVESLDPQAIGQVDKDRARSCVWSSEDLTPDLTIEVDAVAPSPFTGESATQVANSIAFEGKALSASIPAGKGGLGDGAVFAYDSFDDGKNHDADVTVRRGNLLLHVAYEQWFDPPQPKRPAWMKAGIEDIAREVLDANR